ncbi:MAG TPA: LysM peptidoglycan-binding domain-containing protein, partial [Candidatus Saccharimonadales bacterium]|nr:LysM peptidoglycan-binding domain-containing protein [Candidatus Saccharimonadales bacterium]
AGNSAAAQEYDRTAFGQRAEAAAYTQAADNYKTNVANAGAAPAGPTVAGSPPTGTAQAPTPVLTGLNTGTTHSAPAPSHQTTSGGSPVSAINEPSSSVNVSLNGMSHASGVPPYIVKAGDTLTAIAEKYNVPLKELEAANPSIPDPNLIYPGHKVAIPLSIAQSTGGLTGGPGVSVSIAESLKNNPLMGAVNVAEKSPEEGALTGGVSASDKHSTNVHHR